MRVFPSNISLSGFMYIRVSPDVKHSKYKVEMFESDRSNDTPLVSKKDLSSLEIDRVVDRLVREWKA